MPSGKFFTPQDDNLIISLWKKQLSQSDIAEQLGVTKNTIAGRVSRLRARGHDIPRRQGGDPEKKQRQKKDWATAEARNSRLHPAVQRARDKLQAKTQKAKEAHKFSLKEDAPSKIERLPKTTKNRTAKPSHNAHFGFGRMNLKEGPKGVPKSGNLTSIKEVEGTTCTTEFLDLKPGQCRYVHGHGEGKRFCDGVAERGLSYCLAHYEFCHQAGSRLVFDKRPKPVAT